MAQESAFKAKAKPSIRYFLGVVPYGRPSSAYGYSQALDSTWAAYRREAGTIFSQRDRFEHAIDFVQWYMHKSWQINRVKKTDAYNQYLNYHEGWGGFSRGSYNSKRWLTGAARKVKARAAAYRRQFQSCQPALQKAANKGLFF